MDHPWLLHVLHSGCYKSDACVIGKDFATTLWQTGKKCRHVAALINNHDSDDCTVLANCDIVFKNDEGCKSASSRQVGSTSPGG